jgi:hypothetical protein
MIVQQRRKAELAYEDTHRDALVALSGTVSTLFVPSRKDTRRGQGSGSVCPQTTDTTLAPSEFGDGPGGSERAGGEHPVSAGLARVQRTKRSGQELT